MTNLIETIARAIEFGFWSSQQDAARAALAAIEAAGYRVVPVEPVVSQGAAGEDALRVVCPEVGHPTNMRAVAAVYAAMLAAAPKVTE